jgi:hypothetical protein
VPQNINLFIDITFFQPNEILVPEAAVTLKGKGKVHLRTGHEGPEEE